MKKSYTLLFALAGALASAAPLPQTPGQALPFTVLGKHKGVSIHHGGFGSAAFADPADPQRFYALTDRGPNADAAEKKNKIFLTPGFTPTIGHFEISNNGHVRLLNSIRLKRPNGKPLTGLPNPAGMGATGETALDPDGRVLSPDPDGLDSEGLVVMKDGSFWVSDEYGPHIVHFNRYGVEQERISPRGIETRGRKLPAVLAKRRPNRGMEGLAISPDGKILVGIMQSTLNNPDRQSAVNRTLTRIVTFDLATGQTRQYLYRQNHGDFSNSEIVALDAHRFLVNERDSKSHRPGQDTQKHVYVIDLREATDVSDPEDKAHGLLANGKALEANSWEELAAAGIRPVRKTLVLDLVRANGYPHDKFEAMWLLDPQHLAVLYDDDFAITSEQGRIIPKILPGTGKPDANTLYAFPVKLD